MSKHLPFANIIHIVFDFEVFKYKLNIGSK